MYPHISVNGIGNVITQDIDEKKTVLDILFVFSRFNTHLLGNYKQAKISYDKALETTKRNIYRKQINAGRSSGVKVGVPDLL